MAAPFRAGWGTVCLKWGLSYYQVASDTIGQLGYAVDDAGDLDAAANLNNRRSPTNPDDTNPLPNRVATP